jgi:hypothetical protein
MNRQCSRAALHHGSRIAGVLALAELRGNPNFSQTRCTREAARHSPAWVRACDAGETKNFLHRLQLREGNDSRTGTRAATLL